MEQSIVGGSRVYDELHDHLLCHRAFHSGGGVPPEQLEAWTLDSLSLPHPRTNLFSPRHNQPPSPQQMSAVTQ